MARTHIRPVHMGPAVLIEESAVCHPALLIISGLTALILQGLLMARTLFFQLQRNMTIPVRHQNSSK